MDILLVVIVSLAIVAWLSVYYQRRYIMALCNLLKIKDEKIKLLEETDALNIEIIDLRDQVISNLKSQINRYKEQVLDWQTIDNNNGVIITELKTKLEAIKNNESTGP